MSARWKTLGALTVGLVMIVGCTSQQSTPEVVCYTSVDQIFSEPVLTRFEQQTGIKVNAVYDTEAAKTTGLVNRLLAEKNSPKADVFWNSEIARTITLKRNEVLAPYISSSAADIPAQYKDKEGYWTGFAARARVIIYNTELLKDRQPPTSIKDFIDPQWQGKAVIATPLFGTTATHAASLRVVWGGPRMEEFFTALKNNGVGILPGNATVRDRVAAGQAVFGLTDTDDVSVAFTRKLPVDWVFPDQDELGTLLIPYSVALIRGAPHEATAKRLIDFLLSPEIEELLAKSEAANIPVRKNLQPPERVPPLESLRTMAVDFERMADELQPMAEFAQNVFLK